MHLLAAPYLAATGLLVLAGVLKVLRPAGTEQALRTQGLPARGWLVRGLGCLELAVAVAALAQAPGAAVAVAAAYLAFTVFVGSALARGGPLSSCGCFGRADLPPTWGHVAVTALLSGAAVAVALGRPAGVPALVDAGATTSLAVVASSLLLGWLAYLVLAELPALQEAAKPPPEVPDGPQLFTLTTRSPAT